MSGFQVDVRALSDISERLRGASGRLDGLADAIPPPPADGPGAPLVAQLLAELVRRSAEITTGLLAAAEVTAACHDDYRRADGSFPVPAGHPAQEHPS
jgi:hypothetical protein